ncbi:hypothetical protein PSP6_160268 [Paraburkholderia tropica]|nr:hypothetical protein PSP6_160268 [Paraburkholderia tropica]
MAVWARCLLINRGRQSQNIIGVKLRDDNVCGSTHDAMRKARDFPRNRHTAHACRSIIETGDEQK